MLEWDDNGAELDSLSSCQELTSLLFGFLIVPNLNGSQTLSLMFCHGWLTFGQANTEEDQTNRVFNFTDIHFEGSYPLIL